VTSIFPLPADPKGRTFFYGGSFSRRVGLGRNRLRWRELTGSCRPARTPTSCASYACALRQAGDGAAGAEAIEEFFGLVLGLVSTDHAKVRLHERVKKAEAEGVRSAWPNLDWVDRATSSEKFLLTPWYHEGKLEDWRSEEMAFAGCPPPHWR